MFKRLCENNARRSLKDDAPDYYAAFLAALRSAPDAAAIVTEDERLSRHQLAKASERIAAQLHELGVGRGDRVAVVLRNGRDYVETFLAVIQLGAVAVPVDRRLARAELSAIIDDCEPKVVVLDNDSPYAVSPSRSAAGANGPLADCIRTPARLRAPTGDPPAARPAPSPETIAAIFYTSGAGGVPHGVEHSHRGLLQAVTALDATYRSYFSGSWRKRVGSSASLLFRYRFRLLHAAFRRQVWMTPLSFSSIAGHTILGQCLLRNRTLVTEPNFNPRRTLRLVQRERVSVLALTPTMATLILRVRGYERYDLSSLLVVGLGGSPVASSLAHELKRRLGCALAIGYGSTELGGGVLATNLSDPDYAQAETVGRPFAGVEIRVVDDVGNPMPTGAVGELLCRAESMMTTYTDHSTGPDEDRWYHTGDMATIDANGFVKILGRKSDMIITGGHNVFPEEVEAALMSHAAVGAAAVVGLPDPVAGERVCALVVKSGIGDIDAAAAIRHCAASLARFKIPDHVHFVDELPVAGDGKIRRFIARDMAASLNPQLPW